MAQSYPTKPVRLIIGYVPGGAADFTARLIAQRLQMPQQLAQPVIVESRPGAGSTLAIHRVATSPPDGYTLLLISEGGLVQSARGAKLPYDFERDLSPISFIAVGPQGLVVHPTLPARNVKELIALARRHPGKLSFGSSGNGSAQHLAGELFNLTAQTRILHVPFKGGAQSAVAVASGEIEMAFATIPSALPFISSNRLRLLAITLPQRASFLRDTPTLNEAGLAGYEYSAWYGVMAPAATPPEIIARLNEAIGKVVNTADMKELLNKGGLDPQTNTPREFAAFVKNQLEKSRKLIKLAGISAD
ncbi:MAG TPA: tripartite tricarboxylate transporter substrate binding protein [Burkholderiales bacterium]|nr:tripartite tricarboxylate transporter substrate binding protein [Burkholderiales bacterium]